MTDTTAGFNRMPEATAGGGPWSLDVGRTALPDFKLEIYVGHWEFKARYNMTASDAESLSVRYLLALPKNGGARDDEPDPLDTLLDLRLHYTEPSGAPDLRAAIAATYQRCAADDVLCFAGAEEGIYCFYHTVLDGDAHAVVVTPNYQSAETVPLSICATTGVALDESDGWTLHIDQVEAAIRPATRAVYISFPHNPTGKILERDRFDVLVELCRRHGLWLFSDEVYRLIEHDPAKRLPQVADVYERGVSLNVMSKTYGLPGLRIGWITCRDRSLLGRMARFKNYLSICNSGPSERLALLALDRSNAVLERTRAIARDGYAKAAAFLAEFPDLFDAYRPDGGVTLFPRYKGPEGVEDFCRRLVEEVGALLLPSSVYASALTPISTDRFRLGYGRSDLDEGLVAMRSFIRLNGG